MQFPLTLFHIQYSIRIREGIDKGIIARNKEGARETSPFREVQALSGRLVPFITHRCIHVREDEMDDERRPSVMVRGSQSFHDLRGEQYSSRTNRKETREREKEREKFIKSRRDYIVTI